jgi:hypothetical protein
MTDPVTDTLNQEQFRHECERRTWIELTGGDIDKLRAVMKKIEAKRGKPAADRVRKTIWDMMQKDVDKAL